VRRRPDAPVNPALQQQEATPIAGPLFAAQ
jgi:hypothetical protein